MRVADKMELLDQIGRELQSRYTFEDIDTFLAAFEVSPPTGESWNSKRVYSKAALRGVPESVLFKIAEELELAFSINNSAVASPPRNWESTTNFRLFISHLAKDKLIATRLKECLAQYDISGFVAHEDIEPTLEWQEQIERALKCMDAFLAIHTEGFSKSYWTQQEVGYALGRNAKVISFKWGEDPTGFISKQQALPRRNRKAEEIASQIRELLATDSRTKEKLESAQSIPF